MGHKALTVQMLLEKMPDATLLMVVEHVSRYGWSKCMLSDDSLPTKKIRKAGAATALPCLKVFHYTTKQKSNPPRP